MQIALPGGSVWGEFEGHLQEKSLEFQPWFQQDPSSVGRGRQVHPAEQMLVQM